MEIIIKIPKEIYTGEQKAGILPILVDGTEGYDCQTWNRIEIGDIIEDAPTIIEGSDSE